MKHAFLTIAFAVLLIALTALSVWLMSLAMWHGYGIELKSFYGAYWPVLIMSFVTGFVHWLQFMSAIKEYE